MRLSRPSRRATLATLAASVVAAPGSLTAAGPADNPFFEAAPVASASLGRPTASSMESPPAVSAATLDGPPPQRFEAFRPTAATPDRLPPVDKLPKLAAPLPRRPAPVAPVNPASRHELGYLPTRTAQNRLAAAEKKLQTAQVDLDAGAHASAEASCWEALAFAAEATDLQTGGSMTGGAVTTAKAAIDEASDFVGPYCDRSPASVARIARSHRTSVVREAFPVGRPPRAEDVPAAAAAIDRYLDVARGALAGVAARSVVAARAIDLIAAVRLARGEADQLPQAVALCLRRAAVQGQGGNADLIAKLGLQLAESGFESEARWALSRSLQIQPTQNVATAIAALDAGRSPTLATGPVSRRVPQVTAVSPTQFAATSRPPVAPTPKAPVRVARTAERPAAPAPSTSVGQRVLSAIRWW